MSDATSWNIFPHCFVLPIEDCSLLFFASSPWPFLEKWVISIVNELQFCRQLSYGRYSFKPFFSRTHSNMNAFWYSKTNKNPKELLMISSQFLHYLYVMNRQRWKSIIIFKGIFRCYICFPLSLILTHLITMCYYPQDILSLF